MSTLRDSDATFDEDPDRAVLLKHLARLEERVALFASDKTLADRFATSTLEQARALIDWLDGLESAGPLAQDQLAALIDRGDDALAVTILQLSSLERPATALYARAVAALDSSNPELRAAAIGALGIHDAEMPASVCDKISRYSTDPSELVRGSVAHSIGERRPEIAARMVDDAYEDVRYAAAYALVRLNVEEYTLLGEATADKLVKDRLVRPVMRTMAAELFVSPERIRAAFELLAREGIPDAIQALQRGTFHSAAWRGPGGN